MTMASFSPLMAMVFPQGPKLVYIFGLQMGMMEFPSEVIFVDDFTHGPKLVCILGKTEYETNTDIIFCFVS